MASLVAEIIPALNDCQTFKALVSTQFNLQKGQWTAETTICMTRPAQGRKNGQKAASVPGEPIDARLVVSRILSESGEILAQWLLITNVLAVTAAEIALWYYWRWQIESFFKLPKKSGA